MKKIIINLIAKSFLAISITGIIIVGGSHLITKAVDDSITMECQKLKGQSIEYKDNHVFKITKSEDSICRAIGIIIDAPIYETTLE